MTSVIGRGIVAGAVGTVLLNAATYVDMVLTGREASSAPGQTVLETAHAAGLQPPSDDARLEAYGALGGMAAGVGIGIAASAARRLGVRVSAPAGAVLTGLAAMAATDGPMAATGVGDPTTWSASDWARDLLPHLAFGLGVRATLDAMPPVSGEDAPLERATAGLLVRSLVLGAATGARASFGVLVPAISGGPARSVAVSSVLAATELVVDKLPSTTSRLELQGLVSRATMGALGGATLAAHESCRPLLPALAGVAGAGIGSIVGAAWREAAADRGWTWQGAVAEDAAAAALLVLAVRGG